jgi:hypothetical protein
MGKLVEVVGKVTDLEGGQVCIQDFFVSLPTNRAWRPYPEAWGVV